jgi:N-acetylglucosamine-6-phosphate deacetylase
MEVIGRHYRSAAWVRVRLEGPSITAVEPIDGPEAIGPDDEWIAPAFWDIQTNGRWGISFADPTITVDQVAEIVRAQAALGTARLCPTLFTASPEATSHGVRTVAAACDRFPDVAAMVLGIHLEGPYISPQDGYRGAHPRSAVRDPDWDELQSWQDQSGGRIALMTLAPERPGALEFIRRAVASGIVIALGHTAADPATLHAAAEAGATLSTHLGNGIAATLPRHPNAIFAQAADDRLMASLIADGHHLDPDTLKVLVRSKAPSRIILVSDASPLAGLPPGRHGEWEVDPVGKIVVAGTPYLAGSNQDLRDGLNTLLATTDVSLAEALATVTNNPARLLGRDHPRLESGQPASLVRFRWSGTDRRFSMRDARVNGSWHR